MSIEIISPGLSTTIQDKGRLGVQNRGIPVSGFMDAAAANLANLLLNNTPNTALLEMTLLGITFKTTEQISIAITGANMQPKVNGKAVSMNKVLNLTKNSIVSLSASINGVYGYISFHQEILVSSVFNSKSTYTPAFLGGYKGRRFKKGDTIQLLNTQKKINPNTKVKRANYDRNVVLECLKGLEWNEFSKKAQYDFLKTTFTISQDSNRIGIRLEGELVNIPTKDEIISSGIVKGTVQITKGGQAIVMMADAPTTGGYLRMINLTEKACCLLAQTPIGGTLTFKLIS